MAIFGKKKMVEGDKPPLGQHGKVLTKRGKREKTRHFLGENARSP